MEEEAVMVESLEGFKSRRESSGDDKGDVRGTASGENGVGDMSPCRDEDSDCDEKVLSRGKGRVDSSSSSLSDDSMRSLSLGIFTEFICWSRRYLATCN